MTAPAPAARPAGSPVDARYIRLVGCAAAVGIPAGFLAAAFLALVHALEDVLWSDAPRCCPASCQRPSAT